MTHIPLALADCSLVGHILSNEVWCHYRTVTFLHNCQNGPGYWPQDEDISGVFHDFNVWWNLGPFPATPPPFCQHFPIFWENHWSWFLKTTHGWPMGVGKSFCTHFGDLRSRSLSYWGERNLHCPHSKGGTAHPIATKLGRYIPLIMFSTWLHFGEILK